MLVDREKARMDRDWSRADRIRDELGQHGVYVDDRTRSWTATDGRSGRRPNAYDEPGRGDDRRDYDRGYGGRDRYERGGSSRGGYGAYL